MTILWLIQQRTDLTGKQAVVFKISLKYKKGEKILQGL